MRTFRKNGTINYRRTLLVHAEPHFGLDLTQGEVMVKSRTPEDVYVVLSSLTSVVAN